MARKSDVTSFPETEKPVRTAKKKAAPSRLLRLFSRALNVAVATQEPHYKTVDAVSEAAKRCRKMADHYVNGRYGPQLEAVVPLAAKYHDVWIMLAITTGREDTLSPDLLPEVERVKAYLSEDRDE